MYYNGTILRLFPDEIVKVFGKIFVGSIENDAFVANADKNKDTITTIKNISEVLVDKSYEMFNRKFA